MPNLYAFRDKKSGVLSNCFITNDPFSKVKQSVSISLLDLSFKEKTSPFVLFASDYDLIKVSEIPDEIKDFADKDQINLEVLLAASRKAYETTTSHTSPNDQLENALE